MSKLDLLSRLRKAETGSPELSAEVFKALNPDYKDWKLYPAYPEKSGRFILADSDDGNYIYLPQLTQSIDAAVEAVVKADYRIKINQCTDYWLLSMITSPEDYQTINTEHRSLPLAICIALLEAKQ